MMIKGTSLTGDGAKRTRYIKTTPHPVQPLIQNSFQHVVIPTCRPTCSPCGNKNPHSPRVMGEMSSYPLGVMGPDLGPRSTALIGLSSSSIDAPLTGMLQNGARPAANGAAAP